MQIQYEAVDVLDWLLIFEYVGKLVRMTDCVRDKIERNDESKQEH